MAEEPKVYYYEEAADKDLEELKANDDFVNDLVNFSFSVKGRTAEEIKEMGVNGLYDEFVEHMRVQSTNTVRAGKDLYYVKNQDSPEEGVASFGRLMRAWDNSKTAGDFNWTKLGDYAQGVFTDPLTYIGILSGGVSSVVAKSSTRAGVTAAIKAATSGAITNEAGRAAVRSSVAGTALKGFAITAATEGAIAYGHETMLEKAREDSQEGYYQYDPVTFWSIVGLSAGLSGVVGGGLRAWDTKVGNEVLEAEFQRGITSLQRESDLTRKALEELVGYEGEEADKLFSAIDSLVQVTKAQEKSKGIIKLRALDKEAVDEGRSLIRSLANNPDEDFGLSLNPKIIARVSAASKEIINTTFEENGRTILLREKLGLGKDARITEVLAKAISEDVLPIEEVTRIKDKWGITSSQFGLLETAAVSDAARILSAQSALSRAEMSKLFPDGVSEAAKRLTAQGVMTVEDKSLYSLQKQLRRGLKDAGLDSSDSFFFGIVETLRNFDKFRVSMMTSQPGTAVANFVSGVAMTGVDMSDRFWKNIMTHPSKPFKGVLDVVAGMTYDRQNAQNMMLMLGDAAPIEVREILKSGSRFAVESGSASVLGKIGRFFNTHNTLVEGVFKEAMFYASVNRQLLDKNTSWKGFLSEVGDVKKLDPRIILQAKEDALSLTFQRSYKGDLSTYGRAADWFIETSEKIPFLLTSWMPFPRYQANHIEKILDYTPLVGPAVVAWEKRMAAKLGKEGLDKLAKKTGRREVLLDPFKSKKDRYARSITGTTILISAIMARASQQGKGTEKYTQFIDDDGYQRDVGRIGGPYNAYLALADGVVSYANGEGPPTWKGVRDTSFDIFDAATGVTPAGYTTTMGKELITSIANGNWTEGWKKAFGDFVATFTYPAAFVRDVYAQFEPNEAGPTPYTRHLSMARDEEDVIGKVNLLGMWINDGTTLARATSMLPDFPFISYTNSFNGRSDVPLYDPTGGVVKTYYPLLNQITALRYTRRPNTLQTDMSTYGIKPWDLYSNSTTKNAAADYLVRFEMSKTVPQEWEILKAALTIDSAAPFDTWSEEQKKEALEYFFAQAVQRTKERVEEAFTMSVENNPVGMSGYIRQAYVIADKEAKAQGVSMDTIAIEMAAEQGLTVSSANEWLELSKDLNEELIKRQYLMDEAKARRNAFESVIDRDVRLTVSPETRRLVDSVVGSQ